MMRAGHCLWISSVASARSVLLFATAFAIALPAAGQTANPQKASGAKVTITGGVKSDGAYEWHVTNNTDSPITAIDSTSLALLRRLATIAKPLSRTWE